LVAESEAVQHVLDGSVAASHEFPVREFPVRQMFVVSEGILWESSGISINVVSAFVPPVQ
jgi:hypothetical protein